MERAPSRPCGLSVAVAKSTFSAKEKVLSSGILRTVCAAGDLS